MERQKQIVELIQSWNSELETRILAENFYMDQSRKDRMSEMQEILDKAGAIQNIGDVEPSNQLRGNFKLQAENGVVNIFFTLTPEKAPKVQQLDVSFQANEHE